MNKKIAPFKNLSFFLLILIIPLSFINGCGDLEPEIEDKRSVFFNMDYLSNQILRFFVFIFLVLRSNTSNPSDKTVWTLLFEVTDVKIIG